MDNISQDTRLDFTIDFWIMHVYQRRSFMDYSQQVHKYTLIILGFFFIAGINIASAALSDTYELSEGDMAALQLNIYGQSKWRSAVEQYDAPFLAYYSETDGNITIQIFGSQDKVESARNVIDWMRGLLDKDFIPSMKNNHGIDMIMNDIKIIYRNRTEEGMRKILNWQHGKYVFPINE
jgi:hypothetical protein